MARSGAVLLPATLGAIGTEKSGASNLGVEGVMVFGAMVGYAVAFQTDSPPLGLLGAAVVGGMLMGLAGGVLPLSVIGSWTEWLTGGRGCIALGLVAFANWHPLWAVVGTLRFGGFEVPQLRLRAPFPGARYLLGVFPYLVPIIALPLIGSRLDPRRSGAPEAPGLANHRERRD